jgi:hypothetical protein
MIALGASLVVAEGLEISAVRILDDSESDHVLNAYLIEMDAGWSAGRSSVDAVTGLASADGFEIRLAELGMEGGLPRLGLVDIGF